MALISKEKVIDTIWNAELYAIDRDNLVEKINKIEPEEVKILDTMIETIEAEAEKIKVEPHLIDYNAAFRDGIECAITIIQKYIAEDQDENK